MATYNSSGFPGFVPLCSAPESAARLLAWRPRRAGAGGRTRSSAGSIAYRLVIRRRPRAVIRQQETRAHWQRVVPLAAAGIVLSLRVPRKFQTGVQGFYSGCSHPPLVSHTLYHTAVPQRLLYTLPYPLPGTAHLWWVGAALSVEHGHINVDKSWD